MAVRSILRRPSDGRHRDRVRSQHGPRRAHRAHSGRRHRRRSTGGDSPQLDHLSLRRRRQHHRPRIPLERRERQLLDRLDTIPDSNPTQANATSYTVTGLLHPNPPQVYTFEVRAKNANGAGAASNRASETFDVPAQIARLTATTGDQTVTLPWDAPDNNGRKITHYQHAVLATRLGESIHTVVWPQPLPGSDGAATSATVAGLANGIPHVVLLGAVNAVGTPSSARQDGLIPAATPSKPRDLAAEPGNGAATLSWTEHPSPTAETPLQATPSSKTGLGRFRPLDHDPQQPRQQPGPYRNRSHQRHDLLLQSARR